MLRNEIHNSEYLDCTDSELVRAAVTDPAAFAELYDRHVGPVYRYIRSTAESEGDAADLTQHVFIRAFEALPRYEDRGLPFRSWLIRMARNAVTDTFRDRRRLVPWEHLDHVPEPVAPGTPETETIRVETLNQLRLLVMQLNPERRELVILRFSAGLTSREIAGVVGKSEAAVKRQLSRTLRSLREAYDARQD